jgi:hypothetical protein
VLAVFSTIGLIAITLLDVLDAFLDVVAVVASRFRLDRFFPTLLFASHNAPQTHPKLDAVAGLAALEAAKIQIEFGRSRTGKGSSGGKEEGGGVRSGPGAARTIPLFSYH